MPVARGHGRGNRDAPLLLLGHPIHDGFSVVHFTHFIGTAGVVKYPFRYRGLAGIDMCHDADIPDLGKL